MSGTSQPRTVYPAACSSCTVATRSIVPAASNTSANESSLTRRRPSVFPKNFLARGGSVVATNATSACDCSIHGPPVSPWLTAGSSHLASTQRNDPGHCGPVPGRPRDAQLLLDEIVGKPVKPVRLPAADDE